MPQKFIIPQIYSENCIVILTDAFAKHEIENFTISKTTKVLEIHGASPLSTEALNEILVTESLGDKYKVDKIPEEEPGTSIQWRIFNYLFEYRQLLKVFGIIVIFSFITSRLQVNGSYYVMLNYIMGSYFLVFGIVKTLNLQSVADNFKQYDLLAKYIPYYGLIYPYLEIVMAIIYFSSSAKIWPEIVTIIIFSSTFIGVAYRLWKKMPLVKCACFGGLIDLSISSFTLIENGFMILCAVGMILIEIIYKLK